MNKVFLTGNITHDLEIKDLSNGTKFMSFKFATNRKYRKSDGEEVDEATFIKCVTFGKTAEHLHRLAGKGAPLVIMGRLNNRTLAREEVTILEVVIESFRYFGPKAESRDDDTFDPDI